MEREEIKYSKFSGGLAQIYRLDELWKDTNRYSRQGKYALWNSTLDRIWCELARDLDDKKYKEKSESLAELNIKIGNIIDSMTGFKVPDTEALQKRGKQYKSLMEKDLFLRRLENELGKGTSFAEEEDDWE